VLERLIFADSPQGFALRGRTRDPDIPILIAAKAEYAKLK
jgi:hypothetical protein